MTKENITKFALSAILSAAVCVTLFSQPASAQTPAPSLKEIYKDDFLIGTAIDIPANNGLSPSHFELIKSQFNIGPGLAAGGPAGPATGPATQGARRGARGAGGPGGRGGLTTPPTAEQLQAQADAYAKLFAIFLKHKDVIDRVTFWGINDGRSWRRGQAPLLHDAENKPKPAFNAVVAAKK